MRDSGSVGYGAFVVSAALLASVAAGCASSADPGPARSSADGKYDTAFPDGEVGHAIEEAFRSVRMINCIAYYKEYTFRRADAVDAGDLPAMDLLASSLESQYYRDTASGTAVSLPAGSGWLALLTSAHVVHFPDTILTFFAADPESSQYVRSVAIRERQVTYIPDVEGADELDIIAIDQKADLALVGQALGHANRSVPPLRMKLGTIADLQWGSFVYVLGNPAGIKMVTRGLASRPVEENRRSFVIDATFNNGFSGGVVLAVKDGVPHLEWIGIATSSAALTEWTLVPSVAGGDHALDPVQPYEGEIYALQRKQLRYGITICISSDRIRSFVAEKGAEARSRGFRIDLSA